MPLLGSIIAEAGYEEYFLTFWNLLQECAVLGIGWITRGSATDSLVCCSLGISNFCPIRFELYFNRFLNRDRMALQKAAGHRHRLRACMIAKTTWCNSCSTATAPSRPPSSEASVPSRPAPHFATSPGCSDSLKTRYVGLLRSTFGVVAYEEHILQISEAFAVL